MKRQEKWTGNRVCVIAGFCPANRGGLVLLGGAAKISATIQGMRENGFEVLLINSGHQLEKTQGTIVRKAILGGQSCIEVQPPTFGTRNVGKLLQCLIAPLLMARIIYRWKPQYIWIYNPYLFEVISLWTAKVLNRKSVAVLQLEDLPGAWHRTGTGMIKDTLDRCALKMALRIVDGATMVQKKMCHFSDPRRFEWYMPGLVSQTVKDPSMNPRRPLTIGYFGGLVVDRGVDTLIAIMRKFNGNGRWIICGAGPLAKEVETAALEFPDRIRFLGCLGWEQIAAVYGEVDVILNLHKPLESFAGGVFPCKILEAVAHGKLVISTPLLGCPDEIVPAIHWLQGDPFEAGLSTLARIEEIEMETRPARQEAARWVIENYSSRSAMGRIFTDLKKARPAAVNVVPNFFIIGAQKSGTTSLSAYLKRHPNIYFPTLKEPHYFDQSGPRRTKLSLQTYLSLFSKADPAIHKAIGEGSTGYLISKVAVSRILKFNPNARFIVMLRNPIDLVHSWHSHMYFQGVEKVHEFEAAWRMEGERRRGKNIPVTCWDPRLLFYSELGKLGEQVEYVFSVADRDRVKVILFDDLVANPKRIYEEVLAFLQVPSDGREEFPVLNENRQLRWPWLQRSLAFFINYFRLIRSASGLKLALGRGWFQRLLYMNSKPVVRMPMSPVMRAELTDFYREDTRKLSRLTGFDLSHWVSKYSKP